jgi:hypothetical protein
VTREVTATGTTSAAAERALRQKLVDRQTPTQQGITADTTITKLAAAWLAFLRDEGRIETTTINEYDRVERLDVLGHPGIEIGSAVTQATAELDRAGPEPGSTRTPGVQRRLRNREVRRGLVDSEDAAQLVGVDRRTHRALLRDHEDRFALFTEGVHGQPPRLWRTGTRSGSWTRLVR